MSYSRKSASSGHSPPAASPGVSRPVSNTFWCRYSTILGAKLLKRTSPYHGNVVMVTDKLCVRYWRRVHLSEASTMRFVSQHTTIPAPEVLCAFEHSGMVYIMMERINGDMLGKGWLLSQLADMEGTASVDRASLYDCRVPGNSLRFGPFGTVQDFYQHLQRDMEFDPRLDTEVQDLFKQQDNTWPLSFTHGDLSSLNILARGDDIVGVIDWETAGWYPSYWEYTCAHQIDKFLQPMPEKLAMEQTRQKYFGDV
ncbi:kinase-like protein [Aspergillus filifer]